MKTVYLAGPDVFRDDCLKIIEFKTQILKSYGFSVVSPIDKDISEPRNIFEENIKLIKSCDIVLANLEDFQCGEPDSGTVFEIGFAYALDKHIYGYNVPDKEYKERARLNFPITDSVKFNNSGVCETIKRFKPEDFSMPLNLMLYQSIESHPNFMEAVMSMRYQE